MFTHLLVTRLIAGASKAAIVAPVPRKGGGIDPPAWSYRAPVRREIPAVAVMQEIAQAAQMPGADVQALTARYADLFMVSLQARQAAEAEVAREMLRQRQAAIEMQRLRMEAARDQERMQGAAYIATLTLRDDEEAVINATVLMMTVH